MPRALACSAAPITAVVSARRGATTAGSRTWVLRQARQRARRGRRATVVGPWSRTVRARACPQGCSEPAHRGQVNVPAARSVSAWPVSAMPIIGSRWGHGARAWSTRPTAGRGQLVWAATPGGPRADSAGAPDEVRHDADHVRAVGVPGARTPRSIVTVAAPTNPREREPYIV